VNVPELEIVLDRLVMRPELAMVASESLLMVPPASFSINPLELMVIVAPKRLSNTALAPLFLRKPLVADIELHTVGPSVITSIPFCN